ncbi:MAG: BlaI/MecI/CopY family transcriptional regulator [Bacteroidota bacterium]
MENSLLTPLELKVMNILWGLKQAFVKEIIAEWPDEPVPAYNTVSTIVRILEKKGYISHKAFGRSHQYLPVRTKGEYQKLLIRNVVDNVFSGSASGLVSSLLDQDSLSKQELLSLKELIDQSDSA